MRVGLKSWQEPCSEFGEQCRSQVFVRFDFGDRFRKSGDFLKALGSKFLIWRNVRSVYLHVFAYIYSCIGLLFSSLLMVWKFMTANESFASFERGAWYWRYFARPQLFPPNAEIVLKRWCSNFLARGPHLSFRNPSQATRITNLNKNSLKNSLKWLKC